MELSLGVKQRLFAKLVGSLLAKVYELGYECTLGDAYRSPEQAKLNAEKGVGIAKSLHTERLAVDLNLFKDGKYLTLSEEYEPLGTWWEQQHELCRWGGRFKGRPDGNHFSLTHGGRS